MSRGESYPLIQMVYRFGAFELDPVRYRLLRGSEEVRVEPRVLELLAYLVARRGQLVTKEELLREVWQGQYVTEGALSQAVYEARQALGDEPGRPGHIRTVHGRGYRFEAPVVIVEPRPEAPLSSAKVATESRVEPLRRDQPSLSRSRLVGWLAVGMVAVSAAAVLLTRVTGPARPSVAEGGIAVLPMVNATGDQNLDWVELGLMDLLARDLQEGTGVSVIPPAEVVAALRNLGIDNPASQASARAEAMSHSLGAQWLMSTVLSEESGLYRVRATLYRPDEGPRSDTVSGGDLFALTRVLNREVAGWLGYPPVEAQTTLAGLPDDPEIQRAFAQAMHEQLGGRPEEARRYLELCLELDPHMLLARYELAVALRKLGKTDEAIRVGRQVLEEAERRGDQGLTAKAHNHLGIIAWRRGETTEAEDHYRASLALHRALGDLRATTSNLINLGILASGRSDWPQAQELYQEALKLARQLGDQRLEAYVFNSLGVLAWKQGDIDRSGEMHAQALALRREVGDRWNEAASLNNLGTVAQARGELERARKFFDQALALRRELGDTQGVVSCLNNLGALAHEQGRLAAARQQLAEAWALLQKIRHPGLEARILCDLGWVARSVQDLEEAETLTRQALEIYTEVGDRAAQVMELYHLALVAGDRGDLETMKGLLQQGRRLADPLASAHLDALLEWGEGRLRLHRGEVRAAEAHFRRALELARIARNPKTEAQLTIELASLLVEQGALEEARRLLAFLAPSWEGNGRVLRLQARLFYEEGDFQGAVLTAERARQVLGEMWREEDEAELVAYRQAAELGRRVLLPAFSLALRS